MSKDKILLLDLSFFDKEEMKILESHKNGQIYQNIYLKLKLLSLKNNGDLLYKNIPYTIEMLSHLLRINIDVINTAIDIFKQLDLIRVLEDNTIHIN